MAAALPDLERRPPIFRATQIGRVAAGGEGWATLLMQAAGVWGARLNGGKRRSKWSRDARRGSEGDWGKK